MFHDDRSPPARTLLLTPTISIIAGRFYGNDIVFEFVFGMLLAVAWQRGFKLSPFMGAVLIGAGSVGLLLHLPLPRSITFGLPALLVVAGCLYVKLPEWRWAVVLGDASYALYLSHLFTLGVLRAFLPSLLGDGALAAWSFVVISLVVCTLACLPVHYLIDNWLLRRERYEGFRGTKAPVPPLADVPRQAPVQVTATPLAPHARQADTSPAHMTGGGMASGGKRSA